MDHRELPEGAGCGAELIDILLACPSAGAGEETALLRKGYAAIREAAEFNSDGFGGLPSAARFEAMLVCGAPESAAMSLVPAEAGFMLSRGGNGRHIGSVFVPECGEHIAEGNTAALAIMAAILSLCHALLRVRTAPAHLLN